MALFSRKQADEKTDQAEAQKTPQAPKAVARPTDRDLSGVIIKPRITEKAVGKSEQNVYTFVVRKDATKYDVHDAVKELFSVTPVKVNIVNKTPRQFMSRAKGRKVTEAGMKKAYVFLKKGDSISLI